MTAGSRQRQLVWFRDDLRVTDNSALSGARAAGPVIGLFCVCRAQWQAHGEGPLRRAFLLASVAQLSRRLAALGMPLLVVDADTFAGSADAVLEVLVQHRCSGLHFNREYPLNERRRDALVARRARERGIAVHAGDDGTIAAPGSVRTAEQRTYSVFTPFRRRWRQQLDRAAIAPLPAPPPQDAAGLPAADTVPRERHPLLDLWPAGEIQAQHRLQAFIDDRIVAYADARNFPARHATSTLSPYLATGAISARQCAAAAADANFGALHDGLPGIDAWISELVWRDFYRHLMAAFDDLSRGRNFRAAYDALRWRQAPADVDAWRSGLTGIPIVDAAQRQLLATGWMHNRLRMVTASFLTRHLLIDWRQGEAHFASHLVDVDLAANNGGWQWAASTGTDAQPYFRIFNPVTQGRRFDPDGTFVRRYVPELADVDARYIHQPWRIGGHDYPPPVVDLAEGRARALATFRALRSG